MEKKIRTELSIKYDNLIADLIALRKDKGFVPERLKMRKTFLEVIDGAHQPFAVCKARLEAAIDMLPNEDMIKVLRAAYALDTKYANMGFLMARRNKMANGSNMSPDTVANLENKSIEELATILLNFKDEIIQNAQSPRNSPIQPDSAEKTPDPVEPDQAKDVEAEITQKGLLSEDEADAEVPTSILLTTTGESDKRAEPTKETPCDALTEEPVSEEPTGEVSIEPTDEEPLADIEDTQSEPQAELDEPQVSTTKRKAPILLIVLLVFAVFVIIGLWRHIENLSAIGVEDMIVTAAVRRQGGEWMDSLDDVLPDEQIEWRFRFQNISGGEAENVMFRVVIPTNMTEPKNVKLYTSAHQDGFLLTGDIIREGSNIGGFLNGGEAYITFITTVVDEKLVAGKNTLYVWGQFQIKDMVVQNSANVVVYKSAPVATMTTKGSVTYGKQDETQSE